MMKKTTRTKTGKTIDRRPLTRFPAIASVGWHKEVPVKVTVLYHALHATPDTEGSRSKRQYVRAFVAETVVRGSRAEVRRQVNAAFLAFQNPVRQINVFAFDPGEGMRAILHDAYVSSDLVSEADDEGWFFVPVHVDIDDSGELEPIG